jgi:hypothetical protein
MLRQNLAERNLEKIQKHDPFFWNYQELFRKNGN